MRLAQVVAVHTERRTVDLVYLDTGLRVAEAHILSSLVASDAGEWNVPSVPKPSNEAAAGGVAQTQGRQLVVAVDELAGRPVVVGMLHPLGGQMVFTQPDRQVQRHSSGTYLTTAPDGSWELYHPSGSYFRIGTGPHEQLAPISANQSWQEVTTAQAPTITLSTPKFTLTVAPNGDVTMNSQGAIHVTASNGMTIAANVDITGNLTATGAITAGKGGGDQVGLQTHRHGVGTAASGTIAPTPGT